MNFKTQGPRYECIQPEKSDKDLNLGSKDPTNNNKSSDIIKEKIMSSLNNTNESTPNESVKAENLYKKLEKLNISHCTLFKIPDFLFKFKYLSDLNLSNNKLENLPNEIRNLQNLRSLNLSGNKLSSLPQCLQHNHQIVYLNISKNKFIDVPSVLFCGLGMVEILDMSFNKISDFHEPPKCLSNLLDLRLSNNALKKLPQWIFNGPCQLQILELARNEINISCEPVINYYNSKIFQTLKVLNIENCNYRNENIQFLSHFKNIEILDMGNGVVSTEGNMNRNYLGTLKMNVFENFAKLRRLSLRNVGLDVLPSDFVSFKNLEYLNLSENSLSWLPETFCVLISLKILDLSSNQLLFLPKNIGDLVNLKIIYLKKNKLDELPQSFSHLCNLEFVDLYQNKIERIDLKIILQKKLKGIDLGENCLDLSQTGINSDAIRKHYEHLKTYFREHFGFVDDRSDIQTIVRNNDGINYNPCENSSDINSFSDDDSFSSVEDDVPKFEPSNNKANQEISQDELWEKMVSPETEIPDDFFDPNEIRYPIWSSNVNFNSAFKRNFCPGYTNVRSLRLKNRRNYRFHNVIEGQFDSD